MVLPRPLARFGNKRPLRYQPLKKGLKLIALEEKCPRMMSEIYEVEAILDNTLNFLEKNPSKKQRNIKEKLKKLREDWKRIQEGIFQDFAEITNDYTSRNIAERSVVNDALKIRGQIQKLSELLPGLSKHLSRKQN